MTAAGEASVARHRRHRTADWARAHLMGWSDIGYALHATLCALLALWLAMYLQLDSPFWAGSTVLITSQASRAQGLLKGVNRMIGTVVGTTVGVALIALYPQGWWSYLGAHTIWLVLCTFTSFLFKDLQSYAAALAGYTALIVAIGSFGEPNQAFDVAVSRGSAVTLGVALFMLTLLLITPSNDAPTLRDTLSAWIDEGLGLAARLLRGDADTGDVADFLPRIATLDSLIESGATEAPWIADRKPLLRGAALALLDCLLQADATSRQPPASEAEHARRLGLADDLDSLRPRSNPIPAERPRGRRGAFVPDPGHPDDEAAAAMIHGARVARGGLAALHRDRLPALRHPIRRILDRDYEGAGWAALRAGVGMGSACVIWVVTRWPGGGDFVEVTGILCCLLASRPSPISNARDFTISTVATGVAALVVGFFILPLVSGFGWLSAAMFPVLFTGALGVRSKRFGGYFTPLNFFFMSMIGVRNVMDYNPLDFFNSTLALTAGALFAMLCFQLMPPPSKPRQAAKLRRRLARAAASVKRGGPAREAHDLLFLQRLGALLPLVDAAERAQLMAEASALRDRSAAC